MFEKILNKFPFLTKLSPLQWFIAVVVAGIVLGQIPPAAEAWFDKNYERNAQPRRAAVYTEIKLVNTKLEIIQTDTRDIKNILMSKQ